jgi:hypothetical protein
MLGQMERFPGAATDLGEALARFDWRNEARMGPRELELYYEPRTSHRSLERLLIQLRVAVREGTSLHALYMGPAGCGKSTDLTWVTQRITDDRRLDASLMLIHYGIGDSVGRHDVGFAEVALSLALEIHERFTAGQGVPELDPSHLRKIYEWLYGTDKESNRQTTEVSGGIGLSLLKYLSASLSSRKVREKEVELRLRRLMPELRELLGALLAEVYEKTGKRVMFVIDDLEKLTPVNAAVSLFLDQAGFFGDLDCHLLFTAPSALRLEGRYQPEVASHFMEYRATLDRPIPGDGGQSSEFQTLRRIVYRRIAPELVEDAAVDRLVMASGGLVSQIIDGMYRSILGALTDGVPTVGQHHVEAEIKELSAGYLSMLRDSHYLELDRIEKEGAASHVEDPVLLHSRCVLEYPDTPTEFAIHPLVLPLLERWRAARLRR